MHLNSFQFHWEHNFARLGIRGRAGVSPCPATCQSAPQHQRSILWVTFTCPKHKSAGWELIPYFLPCWFAERGETITSPTLPTPEVDQDGLQQGEAMGGGSHSTCWEQIPGFTNACCGAYAVASWSNSQLFWKMGKLLDPSSLTECCQGFRDWWGKARLQSCPCHWAVAFQVLAVGIQGTWPREPTLPGLPAWRSKAGHVKTTHSSTRTTTALLQCWHLSLCTSSSRGLRYYSHRPPPFLAATRVMELSGVTCKPTPSSISSQAMVCTAVGDLPSALPSFPLQESWKPSWRGMKAGITFWQIQQMTSTKPWGTEWCPGGTGHRDTLLWRSPALPPQHTSISCSLDNPADIISAQGVTWH